MLAIALLSIALVPVCMVLSAVGEKSGIDLPPHWALFFGLFAIITFVAVEFGV